MRVAECGMRRITEPAANTIRRPTVPILVAQFLVAKETIPMMKDENRFPRRARKPASFFAFLLATEKSLKENMGITVIETRRLNETAPTTAMAISRKSWPASSWIKTTGKNTATVVRLEAMIAPQTSRVPSYAASKGVLLIWR